MDVSVLEMIIKQCVKMSNAVVFKAIFCVVFFGFFRLSNCVPHAIGEFDATRHFTGADVFFSKNSVKLLLKWSKTIQHRDQYKLINSSQIEKLSTLPIFLVERNISNLQPECLGPLIPVSYCLWLANLD